MGTAPAVTEGVNKAYRPTIQLPTRMVGYKMPKMVKIYTFKRNLKICKVMQTPELVNTSHRVCPLKYTFQFVPMNGLKPKNQHAHNNYEYHYDL